MKKSLQNLSGWPALTGRKKIKGLEKTNDQLELLYEISSAVSSTLKIDRLFPVVLRHLTKSLGYDRAILMLFDRKRRLLHSGRIRGATPKVSRSVKGLEIPIDLQYEVLEQVIRRRRPYVANPQEIRNAVGIEREMTDFLKTKAVAVLPLVSKKRLVGVLWVDYVGKEKEIVRNDIRLLQQVASQVAIAIDHAQAYETITRLNANLEEKVQTRTRDLERTGLKLKEAFKALKQVDDFKNRFFANISHELRTPLTLVLAPLDVLLERSNLKRDDRQVLETIKDNSRQLLKMINSLLDLSKINAGKMQLRFHRKDFGKVVTEVCQRVRPLAEAVGICFEFRALPDCWLFVDADQMLIVIQNLLTNALKFTEANGEVRVEMKETDGEVSIEVRDTGRGIPEASLPFIFERFSRGEGVDHTQGMGIGLALASELVELHGGVLQARSVVGSGTVFTLTLKKGRGHLRPEWVVAVEEENQQESDQSKIFPPPDISLSEVALLNALPARRVDQETSPKEKTHRQWRLLIVEDHPDMLTYLKYILSERYEVLTARNGEEGLHIARKSPIDLVVTDLTMAGLGGYGLCKALKKDSQTSNIPVVVVTAHVDTEDLVQGLERYGADDYVTKPFHARELVARVERLLRVREMQAQLLHADKLKALGQLSAGLAHEINNPLGFIKQGVSSLRKDVDALQKTSGDLKNEDSTLEIQKEMGWVLNNIDEGVDRIRSLVKNLREYSRADSGRMEPFRLKDEVDLCLRILESQVRQKEIEVACDLGEISIVYGQSSQIGQVLMNLLYNAVQAVKPQGKIQIRAWTDRSGDEEKIWCQVEDNGIGIPKDHMKRIFNPFFTTKDPGEGLGLGLPICDQIVRAHGGQLQVNSNKGAGAVFTFDLPQQKSARSLISLPNSL